MMSKQVRKAITIRCRRVYNPCSNREHLIVYSEISKLREPSSLSIVKFYANRASYSVDKMFT